jgi:capsular exopolysaccharide synthesis family protein
MLRSTSPIALDEHLVSLLRPTSWEAEPYRTLRYVVEGIRGAAKSLVIAVSSASPGDGKTTTTLNLAAALAEPAGSRVLVVDTDLRRGAVARQLGLEGSRSAGPGLSGAVRDHSLAIDDLAQSFAELPFKVLPAGSLPATPSDVLESPRFGALIEEARNQFGFVLLDTPPFVPFGDCRVLSRWVDGILLVVAAHRTPRKLMEETLGVIEPGKLLGLVFNGDDSSLWGSNQYYRYYQVPTPAPRAQLRARDRQRSSPTGS